jgi:capsular polysaccharide biosynthesis protein
MEQEREEDEFFEEPHPALWRISVVMTRPSSQRESDAASAAAYALDESQLWDAPPGYSLVGQASAPAPVTPVSPRRLTWGVKVLLAAVFVAIAAVFVLELLSIS